jgi:hypothetical protein
MNAHVLVKQLLEKVSQKAEVESMAESYKTLKIICQPFCVSFTKEKPSRCPWSFFPSLITTSHP